MKKKFIISMLAMCLFLVVGCGNIESGLNSNEVEGNLITTNVYSQEDSSNSEESTNELGEDIMYIYSNADEIKDYSTLDTLLHDAYALVKIKVLDADSANVRSYIYTSYSVEVLDILYGEIDENVITVNMPGGIVENEEAHTMISEVTDGKDAGDLSNIGKVISSGNTDRLLMVGDEAYLFIMPESEEAYAVVGEYHGEVLVQNENVIFDKSILSIREGISIYGVGDMSESEFVEIMSEIISDIN